VKPATLSSAGQSSTLPTVTLTVYSHRGTWTDAEAEAVSLGGHLVTINDVAEETWVWDTFSQFGGVDRTIWIGMTDAASEGDWVWISGEPVTFTYWAQVTNEPNNCGGNENYGHIFPPWEYRAPFWNDILNSGEGGCGGGFAINGLVEMLTPPVGGIAELPNVSDSSAPNYIALAAVATVALLALTATAWYARRRWRR